jgi:tetratricopeptide (TPR) repeat protein
LHAGIPCGPALRATGGPLEAEALAVQGDLLAQQGRTDDALLAYGASLKANAKQAWVRFKLARLKWRAGDKEGARTELDAARAIDAGPSEFWKLDGQMRADAGDRAGALDAYREAARRNPRDADALVLIARLEGTADPARAREDLAAALKIDPGSAEALVELGDLSRRQKDLKAAADAYRRVSQLTPEDAAVRCRYAEILEELGQNADALNEYRAAAQADPRADAPRRRLAAIHFAAGRTREAAQALEEVIRIVPDDAAAKVKLAEIRIAEKNYDAAMALLEPVCAKDPQNADAKALLEKARLKKFLDGQ